MHLFVGLGNPGTTYQQHRHNIGFMLVEAIAARHGFGPWRQRFQALVSEGRLGEVRVLLMKPQTYMNDSGQAVGEAVRFHKIPLEQVVVFYDELDLAPGKLRVKIGGGAAGHNGIRSIDAHIGSQYRRVRLGIGHPGHKDLVTNHVLGPFAKSDAAWRDPLISAVADEVGLLAAGEDVRFASEVARHLLPTKT